MWRMKEKGEKERRWPISTRKYIPIIPRLIAKNESRQEENKRHVEFFEGE